jgi:hypothetical protein
MTGGAGDLTWREQMTTTITVETHSWPVEAKTQTYHEHEAGSFYSKQIDIVPPNSKRSFHITQTSRLTFTELPDPKPAD